MAESTGSNQPLQTQEQEDEREAGSDPAQTTTDAPPDSPEALASVQDEIPTGEMRSVWDGLRLATYTWVPDQRPPKALLFIAHGAGEHMGRYEKLKDTLVENGILVYGHDHVGNGRSEGSRMHVNSMETYELDVIQHVENMKKQYPDLPSMILGHSMGGLITLFVVLRRPELFQDFLLSSPLAELDSSSGGPLLHFLARVAGAIVPLLPVQGPINPEFISTVPEEVQAYIDDPLIYHGSLRARWGSVIIESIKVVRERVNEIQLPVFLMHSHADQLAPPTGSQHIFENISSEDKTIEWFDGLGHELLHGHEQEKARRLITDWLLRHIAPPTPQVVDTREE